MELTQEYLDKALSNLATKDDLKPLATKADLEGAVSHLVGVSNETIAEPMERHFEQLKDYLKTKEDVQMLKREMQQIKETLRIT